MKTNAANTIFVIAFMLMLLIPTAFVHPSGGIASEQENRMLASRPYLADIRKSPSGFIRQFDDWFSDNVGFRKSLIDLHKIIERMENQVRYAENYLIGEEGHHYFAGVDSHLVRKFQGKSPLTDDELARLSDQLNEVKGYLDERNIPFIVMFCTDKESVYPEYYPKSIMRGSEPIQLDIITDYLKENTNVDVFNIRQRLLAEKENYLLYNKTADLGHYNGIGGFFAYLELMKHINVHYPYLKPLTLEDIDISYDANGIPIVSLKTKAQYEQLESSFFDNVELDRPFTWENAAYKNNDLSLPTVLFMKDSNARYFLPNGDYEKFIEQYLPQHFGNAIFIHYMNTIYLKEYIYIYNPNIVVFQVTERQFLAFFDFLINLSFSE